MTIICLPVDIDPATSLPKFTAQQNRNAFSGIWANGTTRNLGSQSGMVAGATPTIGASTTTWSVGVSAFVVDPAFTTTQSPYFVAITAAETGAVTAPNATLARKDILYLQINDTSIDSSGLRNAQVLYQAGTPSATPTAPATPARSLLIATLSVPASGGGSPSIAFNQQFAVATGGILPLNGTTQRDSLVTNPYDGYPIYRTDVNAIQIWNGSGWDSFFPDTNAITTSGTGGSIGGAAYDPSKPLRHHVAHGMVTAANDGTFTVTMPAGCSSILSASPTVILGGSSVDHRLVIRNTTTAAHVDLQMRSPVAATWLSSQVSEFVVDIWYQI